MVGRPGNEAKCSMYISNQLIAFLACIIGIRVLGDSQTDLQEARALSHRDDIISIYSNSWGPFDFGFTVEGPGPLVQRTFQIGTAEVSFDHTSCLFHLRTRL